MQYLIKKLSKDDIQNFLLSVDKQFVPEPLSAHVDLFDYASKLANLATHFVCVIENEVVGLTACYLNDGLKRKAYISVTAVKKSFSGKGIGKQLTKQCETEARKRNFHNIEFEVNKKNTPSIQMHLAIGYTINREERNSYYMSKIL